MLSYEKYDEELHGLFTAAYTIRNNPSSTIYELLEAADLIDNALSLTSHMEVATDDTDILHEIVVDRLRCYIERIATYTRLLKNTYGTPQFDELSQLQEKYCLRYMHVYSHVDNPEVQQSQYQLTIMAYQSLAANYFRRGGLRQDKELCRKAVELIDKAIAEAKDDNILNVLQANRQQLLQAIENS